MATIATKVIDLESKVVEFTFAGDAPIAVALSDFSEETLTHATLHGLSQKLGDSYGGTKGDVAEAKKRFEATLAQLKAGNWIAARGEGETKPRTSELAEAIARIKGIDVAVVAANLAKASDEERKALRGNERVKATIVVIRAEKAQARLAKLDAKGEAEESDSLLDSI